MIFLGDAHNFGQRVSQISSQAIFKPRNLFWEWQLLSKNSDFRFILEKLVQEHPFPLSPFSTFPELTFKLNDSFGTQGGEVEKLVLSPVKAEDLTEAQLEKIGASLALVAWLGIVDLHSQNMMFGLSRDGRLIFCPVDIEGLLEDYYLLSQAHLLPSEKISENDSGARELWGALRKFKIRTGSAALCHGYVSTLQFLLQHEQNIFNHLSKTVNLNSIPNRILIRPTREYYKYLESKIKPTDDFSPSELAQLERGDVPYFFRHLDSQTILEFKTKTDVEAANLTAEICKIALTHARFLKEERLSPRINEEKLLKFSFIQLARACTRVLPVDGAEAYGACRISVKPTELEMSYGENLNLSCAR